MMIGAIIGDIVGSRFEFNNHRSKDFKLFTNDCFVTDDTLMTIAVARGLIDFKDNYNNVSDSEIKNNVIKYMLKICKQYPYCGYGNSFYDWIYYKARPYNSYGNGSAMRVSACGWIGKTLEDTKYLAKLTAEVSHNHPEGIKGAQVTASCIYLSRNRYTKKDIKEFVSDYYNINFTLDKIRDTYKFNETCQKTVPQAIEAFLESDSFEDAIRNAISIGGDSDTLAAITGSIAEAYYGVPYNIKQKAESYMDNTLKTYYDYINTKF